MSIRKMTKLKNLNVPDLLGHVEMLVISVYYQHVNNTSQSTYFEGLGVNTYCTAEIALPLTERFSGRKCFVSVLALFLHAR
jgi:hypothetical protein